MRNEWLKLHFTSSLFNAGQCLCPEEQLIFVYVKPRGEIFKRRTLVQVDLFLQVFPSLFIVLFVFREAAGMNLFVKL